MKRDGILEILEGHEPFELPTRDVQRSAVLVPLCHSAATDEVEVILIRRTEQAQDRHSGQVAFPGGRMEPGDASAEATALREANEELGITAAEVTLCGRLDDLLTVTGYHIVPVVGWIERRAPFVPDPREVARVFAVPLAQLLRQECWEHRAHLWRGNDIRVWHFPYAGEDIWGATAFMLRSLVELLWGAG